MLSNAPAARSAQSLAAALSRDRPLLPRLTRQSADHKGALDENFTPARPGVDGMSRGRVGRGWVTIQDIEYSKPGLKAVGMAWRGAGILKITAYCMRGFRPG